MTSPVKQVNYPLTPQDDPSVAAQEILTGLNIALSHNTRQCKLAVWLGGMIAEYEKEVMTSATVFHPGYNTNILPYDEVSANSLLLVTNRDEAVSKVSEMLKEIDLEGCMNKNRANTKSVFVFYTSVRYVMYSLMDPMIGAEEEDPDDEDAQDQHTCIPPLPDFVKRMRSLKNVKSTDKLCLFHAIKHRNKDLPPVAQMVDMFVAFRAEKGFKKPSAAHIMENGLGFFGWGDNIVNSDNCQGKTNSLIGQLETCFELNINLFQLDEGFMKQLDMRTQNNKTKVTLVPVHVCGKHGSKTVNILLDGQSPTKCHAWFITNLAHFCDQYRCLVCNQSFHEKCKYTEHVDRGECLYRYKWPGGPFQRTKSVWEELREQEVPPELWEELCREGEEYPDNDGCVTWDIETNSQPLHNPDKQCLEAECVPVSISWAVKQDGEDPQPAQHLRNSDPHTLLADAYGEWRKQQTTGEVKWHSRMHTLYLFLEMEIIRHGGTVKMTEGRHSLMPKEYQDALRYLSFARRTEAERRCAMHTLCPRSTKMRCDICPLPGAPRRRGGAPCTPYPPHTP
jgi:hypothetical protein